MIFSPPVTEDPKEEKPTGQTNTHKKDPEKNQTEQEPEPKVHHLNEPPQGIKFDPMADEIEIVLYGGYLFPDNTNIHKIYSIIVDSDDNVLSSPYECVCEPSGFIFNPTYNFRFFVEKKKLLKKKNIFLQMLVVALDEPNKAGGKRGSKKKRKEGEDCALMGVGIIQLYLDKNRDGFVGDDTKVSV